MFAVCFFAVLCLAGAGLADNPEFCQQGMCTMDYIPHCMTDGTIVFGCVGLKNAVCKEKKTEQTGWTPSQACRPSDYCENLACTYDLIPHCLSDGSIARGCQALRHAICTKNLTEQMSWSPLTSCLPDGYCESDVCTADLIPHCMNNGDIVHGCSHLKKAVCQDGMVENRQWESSQRCLPLFYCQSKECTKDMIEHCMTDGTVVTGCDALKMAICNDNKSENKEWESGAPCDPQGQE
ncbi:uncharacterized protein [Haliotis cracherodii]|uniref:uncharacterized protein n=1 Tax=Haliotis cracherodii TaxID=6455 RepID=UPI0039ED3094